jgi:acetyltransferase-like isoleucine patch superfamily enzyme
MDDENLYKIRLIDKIKCLILKMKYREHLSFNGGGRILGKLPIMKLPKNGKVVLGHKVVLNSDFKKSNTALTNCCKLSCGINGLIEIGDNTMLNGVSITSYKKVKIGKNCQIASNTFISDTDFHPIDPSVRQRQVLGQKFDFNQVVSKEISIGNNVWICWGSIILKGVTIGDNSVIGAGSVVTKDIPANSIVAGNPARIIRKIEGDI